MTAVLLAAVLLGAMWRELIITPVLALCPRLAPRGIRQQPAHRQHPQPAVRPAGWADEPWPPSRGWRVVAGVVEDLTRAGAP